MGAGSCSAASGPLRALPHSPFSCSRMSGSLVRRVEAAATVVDRRCRERAPRWAIAQRAVRMLLVSWCLEAVAACGADVLVALHGPTPALANATYPGCLLLRPSRRTC